MNTLKKLLARNNEKRRFQLFIEKIKKNEELKIEKFTKKPVYINPSTVRLGCQTKSINFFSNLKTKDYCPV